MIIDNKELIAKFFTALASKEFVVVQAFDFENAKLTIKQEYLCLREYPKSDFCIKISNIQKMEFDARDTGQLSLHAEGRDAPICLNIYEKQKLNILGFCFENFLTGD